MAQSAKKKFPNKVDFYITNVCNLACENCNRFNNYKFTGYQRWDDYKHTYQQWANHVELSAAVLLGGEPLLNPTICDWIRGIPEVFGCDVQVLTNGTQLNQTPGLYKAFAENPYGAHIGISLHNKEKFEEMRSRVLSFLQGPVTEWGAVLNKSSPGNRPDWKAYWSAEDSNNVLVNMWSVETFHSAAIQVVENKLVTYNSDPYFAHQQCGFVKFKSYHFIKGKLYKCGPAALFAEFDKQNPLTITAEDRELINSYRPLSMDNFIEYQEEFFNNLDSPIPQCKFCPSEPNFSSRGNVIYPIRKDI